LRFGYKNILQYDTVDWSKFDSFEDEDGEEEEDDDDEDDE
jgi:hypothetical protein